jgi:hypothetical protein
VSRLKIKITSKNMREKPTHILKKCTVQRNKIRSKNLVRQLCAEGFNSGVKGLMNQHQLDTLSLVYDIKSQCLYMIRALLAHLQEALHSSYLA